MEEAKKLAQTSRYADNDQSVAPRRLDHIRNGQSAQPIGDPIDDLRILVADAESARVTSVCVEDSCQKTLDPIGLGAPRPANDVLNSSDVGAFLGPDSGQSPLSAACCTEAEHISPHILHREVAAGAAERLEIDQSQAKLMLLVTPPSGSLVGVRPQESVTADHPG